MNFVAFLARFSSLVTARRAFENNGVLTEWVQVFFLKMDLPTAGVGLPNTYLLVLLVSRILTTHCAISPANEHLLKQTKAFQGLFPVPAWNYNPMPPYNWPATAYNWSSPAPAPPPWNYPHSSAFYPPSWGHTASSHWGSSWYPPSAFDTPQAPWTAHQSWHPPTPTYPSYPRYQPMPHWDVSTPPATSPAFDRHGFSGPAAAAFDHVDLNAAMPAHVEKIRIYVETPDLACLTRQWGFATAYRRGGRSITLLDVLEAVYNYFQEPVFIDGLPPQYQGRVTGAYTKRAAKAGGAFGGLTRADVLNGRRVLSGMRVLSYGDVAYVALELRHKS
ncbi:hypothetical protein C8R46DRAFT_1221865 [Mycena filopes]|nr:hypothetical protein C8R46DRAFT_1221865 [Mycena filopes]